MLSGARPFQRDTAPETLTAILKGDPLDLPPGVTPSLQRVVRCCLEERPDDRFHSAHDLGLALELLPRTTVTGAAAAVTRAASVPRRKALLYGASSLALLASGLAGGVLLDRRLWPAAPWSVRRLTFRRRLIRSARVAADGQTILYGVLWDGERCRVHAVRVDSPESRPLDLVDANVLAISRSGDLALSLGSHFAGVITYGTLARVPIAGGAPRQMIENVKSADWSPDGSELAIVRRVDGRDRLEFPVGRVLMQPATDEGASLGFARISPDGRHVAFIQYRDDGMLFGPNAGILPSVVGDGGTIEPKLLRQLFE